MKEEYSIKTKKNSVVKNNKDVATVEEFKEAFEIELKDKSFLIALTEIALSKIRYYFYENEMNGITAEGLVSDVLIKFYEGKRTWYNKSTRSLKQQFILTIVSEVRNKFDLEYKKNKKGDSEENNENKYSPRLKMESLYDKNDNVKDYLVEDKVTIDEDNCANEDLDLEIKKAKEALEEDDDIEAYFVFEEILKEGKDNKAIAEKLKMPIKDVQNAKKRIIRKTKNIFYKNKDG